MFVIGIIFVILGLIMLIKPLKFWKIFGECKYKCLSQPSRAYLIYIRVSGIIIIGIGISLMLQIK